MKSTLLGLTLLALMVSGIHPHERGTWWLEVFPVVLGVPFLIASRRSSFWSVFTTASSRGSRG